MEDWHRTWAVSRTMILTITSKRVKEVVQKMCLPVVVYFKGTSCWGTDNLTERKGGYC